MRTCPFIYLPLLIVTFLVVGCAQKPQTSKPKYTKVTTTITTNNKDLMPSAQYDYDKQLKQCIAESDYIAKKDKSKYGKINDALLQVLSGVKSYSSQLSQIDEKNKEIITSMYVYQVNDLCNSISQFYLTEVKKELNSIMNKIKSN